MHSIQLHIVVSRMITFFYRTRLWHRGDAATVRELAIKWFYCVYILLFLISLAMGSMRSDNRVDSIFLAEIAIAVSIMVVKLWVIIWKQKEILEMLDRICIFTVRRQSDLELVSRTLGKFMNFAIIFLFASFAAAFTAVAIAPFIGSERMLFFKIAFPLDYTTSEVNFWIANAFLFTELVLSLTTLSFSVTSWYLMLNCSLTYEIMGIHLMMMGRLNEAITETSLVISNKTATRNIFLMDLAASIRNHWEKKKLINQWQSFCSSLYFMQIGTSGACICSSIYCLAFDVTDNVIELSIHLFTLFYNISEIFMITYFGNEIMVASSRLSYCLFESDWIDQPQSTKMQIIIFGEYLRQPHELVIGKLYPLSLATFTRILKSAYSMFNILKNMGK